VLLFAFVGWEAASHLSAELGDIRRATVVTLIVITVLYLSVSITWVAAPTTITNAVVAVALTFGAVNTYIAGAARLGAAMARDGSLPFWFARGGDPGQTPYRSLALLAALTGVVLLLPADVDTLMRATSACLAAVTTAGVAAAVKLLPPGRQRATAIAATVLSCVALACCGMYLAVPTVVALIACVPYKGKRPSSNERGTR
jgi:amino acid efflux transporter